MRSGTSDHVNKKDFMIVLFLNIFCVGSYNMKVSAFVLVIKYLLNTKKVYMYIFRASVFNVCSSM